jgi:uncharacterized protein (DUF488 family)
MTDPPDRLRIFTVGHSTRTAADFLELLQAHGVQQLADVRTVPRSRRHPQFGREALQAYLHGHGITYAHFPQLGGLRHPRPDSPNTAWRNAGFRGYADHMLTPAFEEGRAALLDFARQSVTAVMCAEAVWWKCHRGLLADALSVAGVDVRHILGRDSPKPHSLNQFAQIGSDGRVSYPGLMI